MAQQERTLHEVTWQCPDSARIYKMKVMARNTNDAIKSGQSVVKPGAVNWEARQLIDFDFRPIGERLMDAVKPTHSVTIRRKIKIATVWVLHIAFLTVFAILFDGPVLFYRNVIKPILGGLSEKTKLG